MTKLSDTIYVNIIFTGIALYMFLPDLTCSSVESDIEMKQGFFVECLLNFDFNYFQSTEVTSSNAMELEGLKRAVTKIKTAGIEIKRIVTDRHPSVSKYLREEHQEIDHRYDVWHIAKGKVCYRFS